MDNGHILQQHCCLDGQKITVRTRTLKRISSFPDLQNVAENTRYIIMIIKIRLKFFSIIDVLLNICEEARQNIKWQKIKNMLLQMYLPI